MKLIVGLGNPGSQYTGTRHNVGYLVVDAIASRANAEWEESKKFEALVCRITPEILLVKPTTFMNTSGSSVSKISKFYNVVPEDICVIHDDLDIALGEYKINLGKGPKVHGGVNSIEKKLGTSQFLRARVGIENRSENISGESYVLAKFSGEEEIILKNVVPNIIHEIEQKTNI